VKPEYPGFALNLFQRGYRYDTVNYIFIQDRNGEGFEKEYAKIIMPY